MILDIPHFDASLFPHFSFNGVLEGLSRFYKTGKRRVELTRELFLDIQAHVRIYEGWVILYKAYTPPEKDLFSSLIYGNHYNDWISPWVRKVMQAFARLRVCRQCLVHACIQKLLTDIVGHGFLPALSAQGSSDEHDNFQPAQIEYEGEPHAGQNLFRWFQSIILRASAKIPAVYASS